MAIQFYLTDAGRNAALSAASLGLNVTLSHIAVGTSKYDPATALANTTLVSEVERYLLNGGSVEPISHTLRFVSNIEPTISEDCFEIGLITDDGVLFAIASTTASTPLIRLVANIVSIATFGMILANIDLTNLIINIDPNTPIAIALMNEHLEHPNPHPQYAFDNDKYDKTGGNISGDATVLGTLTTNNLMLGSFSATPNGFTRLPNNLLLQWGKVSDDFEAHDFPTPFPNACFSLVAQQSSGGGTSKVYVEIVSNTQFKVYDGSDPTGETDFYWFAIGI